MESKEYVNGKKCIKELIQALEIEVSEGKYGFEDDDGILVYGGWFSKKTVAEFKNAIRLLKRVDAYIECTYGLVEGDDRFFCTTKNQELFHKNPN